ncbi:MAG: type II toxin-antitoxin system VapC family toxin [Verrucomicrobia bacterium]|nr:type II toxin-antitoxin system VapC family toxin [Verrucomicrobiota bacterium]
MAERRQKTVNPPRWVLDCSAVAAFLLEEKDGRDIDPLILTAGDGRITITVPSLFSYEMTNVFATGVRKRRISLEDAADLSSALWNLPLHVEPAPYPVVQRRIFTLAQEHRLSAYDAAYLELAQRLQANLKTFDKDLLALKKKYSFIS